MQRCTPALDLYEHQAKRRPNIHQSRLVLRDSRRAASAEGEADPLAPLLIDSTETNSTFYLETMEQMHLDVLCGAGHTISLSKPAEPGC